MSTQGLNLKEKLLVQKETDTLHSQELAWQLLIHSKQQKFAIKVR